MDPLQDLDAVLSELLRESHRLEPDDLPAAVREAARRLGGIGVRIFLADYEQQDLRELIHPSRGERAELLSIDGTVAGHVFRTQQPAVLGDAEIVRFLLPLLDGSHRMGVFEVSVPESPGTRPEQWLPLAGMAADLMVAKSAYGDTITNAQRRRPAAIRAEAQRILLPPLTLITPRVLVSGMLMPSYEVAGDVFDFALNGDTLHIAILDAMGHSLSATITATVAVAAYRNARRSGASLSEAYETADVAVGSEFDDERFATAVFGALDLQTGIVSSVSAGHAPALVIRGNRVVAHSADEPTLPIGLHGDPPQVTHTQLEPGDRLLLFTDGVVEARADDGEFFGEDRLVDELDRALDTGLPAPEAVRLLIHAVAEHQSGTLRDDATLMLVEWRGRDQDRPAPAAR